MTYEIVCTRGPMKGRRWELTQKGVKIGRAESCEVRVEDVAAELFHCIVKLVGGKPVVLNLASDKGVVVNGSYTGEAQLKPMDVICVGNEWFLVSAPGGGKGGSGARMAAAAVALLLALLAVSFVLWRKGQSKPSAAPHPPAAATNDVAQVAESPVTTNRVVRIVGEEIVVTNRIVQVVDNVVVTNYVVEVKRADEEPWTTEAQGDNGYVYPEPTDGLVILDDGKTLAFVPQGIAHVVIPQGVMTIGDRAFADHKALVSVSIPPSVTKIGRDAFRGCDNMTGVFITDLAAWCRLSFKWAEDGWGDGGFDSPLRCAHNLYLNGAILKDMRIPAGVTEVGANAFRGCSMTRVTIPESVHNVAPGAFANGCNLVEFVVPGENRHYKSVDGLLLTRDGKTLVAVPGGIESIKIPAGVLAIGDLAFAGCGKLSKVIIPDGVTSIGHKAFANCRGLKKIEFPPSLAKIAAGSYYANGAFYRCDSLFDICISDLAAWCQVSVNEHSFPFWDKPGKIFLNGSPVKELKIPNEVTRIGSCVFRGCSNITRVTIPRSVEQIGWGAFANCDNLTWIDVAGGNQKYKSDDGLLLSKDGKTLVAVPGGLDSVRIPNGVEVIGGMAFNRCSKLSEVKIPYGVTRIDYKAFAGCARLVKVEIPNSVKIISEGWGTFGGCRSLESVTIPGSVERIGSGLFYGCSSLTNVVIQNGVESIDRDPFWGTRIADITLPNSVKNIGVSAFINTQLKSIVIPNSVTNIGEKAFAGCRQLESVTVPADLKNIHETAFIGCDKLMDANKRPRLTRVFSDGKK